MRSRTPPELSGGTGNVRGDETLQVFAGVLAVEGYQATGVEGGECCSGWRWRGDAVAVEKVRGF